MTKSLTIQYNFLNLPRRIVKANEGQIKVTYSADGQKLMQQTEVFQLSPTPQTETIYYDGEIRACWGISD